MPGDVLVDSSTGRALEFIQTSTSSGGAVVEVRATFDRATRWPPAHRHPKQAEHFTILDGEVQFRIGGQLTTARAGDRVHIPPGAVHQVRAGGPATMRWVTTPALRTEELLRATIGGAGRSDARRPLGLVWQAAALAPFDAEFALAYLPAPVQHILFGAAACIRGRHRQ